MPDVQLKTDIETRLNAEIRSEQAGRLLFIANALALALLVVAVRTVSVGDWLNTGLLCIGFLVVMVARQLNLRGRVELSVSLVLAVIALIVSVSMWCMQGLYSDALLAYPALLVVAGIIASRRMFATLFGLMLSMLALITYASLTGLRAYYPQPIGLGRLVVISSILIVSAIAILLLMRDLRCTRARLQEKILRLQNSEAQFSHLAQHDPLTNLPNRQVIAELATSAIARIDGQGRQLVLLLLDIDNFKAINDSLGYAAGDELLKEVATRLLLVVREADVVSRQGGDEFIVIFSDQNAAASASLVARRIQEAVGLPFALQGMQLTITMSIGIAVAPLDGNDFTSLLRKAELATQQAKSTGRNNYFLFNEKMSVDTRERLFIEQDLRDAVSNGDFVLHYQPIIRLNDNCLIGAEALLRWQHPQRGMLGPDIFIEVAEQTGLITEIGAWVLSEACKAAAGWRADCGAELAVSVNLSAVQFQRGDLEAAITAALRNSQLPPSLLELELTESMLLGKSASFQGRLRALKQQGIRLSIDDFGTGYSNLSYLQRFQVDKLKIDRSFVTNLHSSEPNKAIVTAIIQMARSLRLETTAEGIEDIDVQDTLSALGCAFGQGYHYAKPMPADDFIRYIRQQTGL